MIHFNKYKDENNQDVFEYWFTKGISMNDIELLKKNIYEFAPIYFTQPENVMSFNSHEFFPTTKKYSNRFSITLFTPLKKIL